MKSDAPTVTRLQDYTPPSFDIETVDLLFKLGDEITEVSSSLNMSRAASSTDKNSPLELVGCNLQLQCLAVDGRKLTESEYRLSGKNLIIPDLPDSFQLDIVTHIKPQLNTTLMGLYQSNDMFCTQCEAEGFRNITYFLDRPDVLSTYTCRIEADAQRFPVLLSNGNKVEQGQDSDGRHWVKWHDPHRKPCYLFALVAGDLVCVEDSFKTMSGRDVCLQIFVEHGNEDKCEHAMMCLKQSMAWDEKVFRREYDLDIFMIVAVSNFNMGAMENKGLNIFNDKYILANPSTATDTDYANIQGVIGHEYFHNWSGNRVTCRDWFQLSLKEGLTIFRDQEFSSDMTSRTVKRIEDVRILRTVQFAQDASPMAHPVRPESYMEINNFYTVTIYNKGSEVIRMMYNLLGHETFHKGMDLYFQRHDGQAVTIEDFVAALESASGVDLSQMRLWYSQAGTPELSVKTQYDADTQKYHLDLIQHCPATPDQVEKKPFQIPVAVGLLNQAGESMNLRLQGSESDEKKSMVLSFTEQQQRFTFEHVSEAPTVSLLRGYSAPVKLNADYEQSALAFLLGNDDDEFNRWDAGQTLATKILLQGIADYQASKSFSGADLLISSFQKLLDDKQLDKALVAETLILPSEQYIGQQMSVIDVEAVHAARTWLVRCIADGLQGSLSACYEENQHGGEYAFEQSQVAARSLKNVCLSYLVHSSDDSLRDLAMKQFQHANNMTDSLAALRGLSNLDCLERVEALNQFYQRWQEQHLVLDKWFMIQAVSSLPGTLATVKSLMNDPKFDISNPNKIRALIGAFCSGNQLHFHDKSGEGYEFLCDQILMLNNVNPQVAARIAEPLTRWQKFDDRRQDLMKAQLERLAGHELVKDLYEIVTKSLAGSC